MIAPNGMTEIMTFQTWPHTTMLPGGTYYLDATWMVHTTIHRGQRIIISRPYFFMRQKNNNARPLLYSVFVLSL